MLKARNHNKMMKKYNFKEFTPFMGRVVKLS